MIIQEELKKCLELVRGAFSNFRDDEKLSAMYKLGALDEKIQKIIDNIEG